MKNPFKRREVKVTLIPQEPRLAGWTEPHLSLAAKRAFLDVIVRALAAQRPPRPGEGFVDTSVELDRAVEAAIVYCNDELAARMRALREAVIEESMGGGSTEATRAAQEHFTLGCRLALGMDD